MSYYPKPAASLCVHDELRPDTKASGETRIEKLAFNRYGEVCILGNCVSLDARGGRALFFFNPRQPLLRSAIDEIVRRTGIPEIFERDGRRVMRRGFECDRRRRGARHLLRLGGT